MLDTLQCAPVEHLSDGSEIINHAGLKRFDLVFPVSGGLALPVYDNAAGGDRELTVGVGDVVALKYNLP